MLKLSLFFHIVAALFWIGGMLFLTLIITPFLKTIQDAKERSSIYQSVGRGFRFWGWVAISILVITGTLNLRLMGTPLSNLIDPSFHRTPYGKTLAIKILFVIFIISTSLLHDFIFGPKARNSSVYSNIAKWLGRSNLFIALAIVLFAVFLRLGGF
ncbi:MAG: CopD family protein [Deltaproteobacteria bacterium]|nr:CopD family protein [Deltaproteobacteria bacterium]